MTTTGGVAFKPGDMVTVDGKQHVVNRTKNHVHVGGEMESEVEFGSIFDQLLYPDKGQCGELVRRDKLVRVCRRCMEATMVKP